MTKTVTTKEKCKLKRSRSDIYKRIKNHINYSGNINIPANLDLRICDPSKGKINYEQINLEHCNLL